MRTKILFVLPVIMTLAATCAAQVAPHDPAQQLSAALAAHDTQACLEACRALSGEGVDAQGAVADLIKALATGDTQVQRAAALALGAIGPAAKDAVPALITALKSEQATVRTYAAHALGRIGSAASAAAVPLIDIITDKDPMVRRAARDALKRIDAPSELVLPNIAKILNTADPADAAAAVMTLAELGEAAVPGLCKGLENDATCYWAAMALGEIGPKAAAAVPNLTKLLKHPDAEVRMEALVALGEIGAPARPLADQINQILQQDSEKSVRYAAAFALGMIGNTKVSRDGLNEGMDSDDPFLRVTSAWAALRLARGETPLTRKSTQRIIDGLSSSDEHVRLAAAKALVDAQIPPALVAPTLAQAVTGLEAEGPDRVMPILDAFAALGPKAVPACVRSLEEKRPLRFYALQVLSRLGPTAAPAVPALTETLADPDAKLRREALFALGRIGEQAAPAVSKIAQCLGDDDEDVRHAACFALGSLGPAAKGALGALASQESSSDEFMPIASMWASLKIDPENANLKKKAVPLMIKALTDQRDMVRVEAAYVLAEIGAPAKVAVPALEKARQDSSPVVRQAIAEALKALQ